MASPAARRGRAKGPRGRGAGPWRGLGRAARPAGRRADTLMTQAPTKRSEPNSYPQEDQHHGPGARRRKSPRRARYRAQEGFPRDEEGRRDRRALRRLPQPMTTGREELEISKSIRNTTREEKERVEERERPRGMGRAAPRAFPEPTIPRTGGGIRGARTPPQDQSEGDERSSPALTPTPASAEVQMKSRDPAGR